MVRSRDHGLSRGRFFDQAAVRDASVFVGRAGVVEFVLFDVAFFLRPALVDTFEAPFGAAFVADRFAIDENEDRVGVRGGKNAQRDPTALVDLDCEVQFLLGAVGAERLLSDWIAVDDYFDGDGARFPKAGAFDVPIGLLTEGTFLKFRVGCFVQPGGDASAEGD